MQISGYVRKIRFIRLNPQNPFSRKIFPQIFAEFPADSADLLLILHIHLHGIQPNEHSIGVVDTELTMNCLFEPE